MDLETITAQLYTRQAIEYFKKAKAMKCEYSLRLRWLYSKGAFLVMVWNLLICIACVPHFHLYLETTDVVNSKENFPIPSNWLTFIILSVALLSAPLSGWLADAKFGNYTVFRFGVVLLFIFTVSNCLLLVLERLLWESSSVFRLIYLVISSFLFVFGGCICAANSLPFGLNQLPDASSAMISSFISLNICSLFIGRFLTEVMYILRDNCLDKTMQLNYALIWALVSTLCMTIVLISMFFAGPKWLIIERNSPQSLQIIINVLKFAAKHKASPQSQCFHILGR